MYHLLLRVFTNCDCARPATALDMNDVMTNCRLHVSAMMVGPTLQVWAEKIIIQKGDFQESLARPQKI